MNLLTNDHINLLKSNFVLRSKFNVNEFSFDCLEGEWLVTKNNNHIDVFTFRLMENEEFEQTINDIFYNTEKVTFQ
ncbi:hypothetical protein JOC34_000498 [Virgibacillus halotolerans]|uniref:hypothetical protein n=1 Tax=Virgibacillus halotolerans TaxID=1071053 RepID=UPI00195F24B4|nr:hypothetical protein [Virgibacillus halotolerans]MBM7598141.1 hypothetical protein [Virgibacillus halotolerans]